MKLFQRKKKTEEIIERTVPVLMKDGTIEEYSEHFIITDGKNCVICKSKLYHTSLDCEYLKVEMSDGTQVRASNVYDAERKGFEYCYNCKKEKELIE